MNLVLPNAQNIVVDHRDHNYTKVENMAVLVSSWYFSFDLSNFIF